MAVVINGNGTVTGIAVGGLPDGIVDNGTMADDAIAIADLAATGSPSATTFLRGDNSWQAAGGFSGLVAEQIVTGSNVTSITFTGLDLDAHKSYHVECEFIGAAGSGPIYLYANNLQTGTDYHYQLLKGGGTAYHAEEGDYPRITFVRQGGNYKTKCNIDISYWSGRHFVAVSKSLREDGPGTNDYIVELNAVTKDVELAANLTQLDFRNSDANGIVVGSKIRIYKRA